MDQRRPHGGSWVRRDDAVPALDGVDGRCGRRAGPCLAVVGYVVFPSVMRDPEDPLGDTVFAVFGWGSVVAFVAAILMMLVSAGLRRHPLSYALWVGALMLYMAGSGMASGS